ncbi:TlpA family protein disulfide reductase [Streptomyces cavernicola]|uniref:TlpA disulfide reductase family protein n=1 Tax=Streptomyces cavernicola TaxID=3043613 RepID=A0ABT6SBZ9_9ACTN|nr:TlpA disulfide reductase family protein [Streptomyces sp. B-S-A6]MDI3405172.1 TlpA disulfide reductase family protein [Streptomyces sp. B-S-A6]
MRPAPPASVRVLASLTALAAVLALTACEGGAQGTKATGAGAGGDGFVLRDSGIATVARGERRPAPELRGETVGGGQLDLDSGEFRGKVVVLNLWGSWCGPCRAEAKHLVEVAAETESDGVAFVGIDTRDFDRRAARRFEREFQVPYPSFYDPQGRLLRRFPAGTVSPQGIPSTVVIDKDGRIAARKIGELNDRHLRQMIAPVAAER